jgi:hypothetical protein
MLKIPFFEVDLTRSVFFIFCLKTTGIRLQGNVVKKKKSSLKRIKKVFILGIRVPHRPSEVWSGKSKHFCKLIREVHEKFSEM